jgi:hypothetical protein
MEAVCVLQQNMQHSDVRLQQVEESTKVIADTQLKMDGIYKLLQQWGSSSEMGSVERPQQPGTMSPPPPPSHPMLTTYEFSFMKKQD